MSVRLAIPILGVATLLTSGPAAGASLQGALQPLIMRYEVCAHSVPGTQAEIKVRCAQDRAGVLEEAVPIIDKFYPSKKLDAKLWLDVALTDADKEAARLARRGDAYGPAVLQYTACLADNALADPDYRRGNILYGRAIQQKCEPLYKELVAQLGNRPADRKAKQRLWNLKSTFMSLRWMPVTEEWIMVR